MNFIRFPRRWPLASVAPLVSLLFVTPPSIAAMEGLEPSQLPASGESFPAVARAVSFAPAAQLGANDPPRAALLAKQPWSDASFEIDSSGQLFSWGAGGNLLGTGSISSTNVPTPVWLPPDVTGWRAIACGGYHTLAISSDGQLYNWGSNFRGELGTNFGAIMSPRRVVNPAGVSAWLDVAAAEHSSIAVANDGRIFTWGQGFFGELGAGSNADTNRPTPVPFPTGITAWSGVAAGQNHVLALAADGSLWGWGNNIFGMLGAGLSSGNTNRPQRVVMPSGVSRWNLIAAGQLHSMAVGSDGQLYTWGYNGSGQLGTNLVGTRNVPAGVVRPPGLNSWVSISAGSTHSLGIAADGSLFAWGNNAHGELRGLAGSGTNIPSPVPFPSGVTRWVAAAGGYTHTLAIGNDCRLYAWGDNTSGQLGVGVTGASPGQVQPLIGNTCAAFATAAPNVTIATPADGSSVEPAATSTVVADVNDSDGRVVRVDFYLDGKPLGTSTGPAFLATWSNAVAGPHILRAVATDNAGATTVSPPARVLVNVRPVISISAPASGAIFNEGAGVGVAAIATDTDDAVVRVDFFAGSNLVATSTASANPRTATWCNAVAGVYLLTAVATDANGVKGTSAPVNLIINARPTARFRSPANLQVFTVGDVVEFGVDATDDDGTVTNVLLTINGMAPIRLGSAPFTYLLTNAAPAGTREAMAQATDNRGAQSVPVTIGFFVNDRPSVSLIEPADGAMLIEGESVTLVGLTADALPVVAVPQVQLTVDLFDGLTFLTRLNLDATSPAFRFVVPSPTPGQHAFVAIVTDTLGASSTSAVRRVLVNTRPFIAITGPVSGAVFQEGADIVITAAATNRAGAIEQVEFFAGSNRIGMGSAVPYRATLSGAAAGVYELTARARSIFGVLATSAPVVISVNARPVLTLSRTNFIYTEDDGPVLLDEGAVGGDADAPNFDGGTLTVEFVSNGLPEDRLAIRNQGANAGRIFVSGNTVGYDSLAIGQFEGGASGMSPLVIHLGGKATTVGVTALLRNLTYENSSSQPSAASRLVKIVLDDGDGGTSLPAFILITVRPVNDPPVALPQSRSLNEDTAVSLTLLGSDVDRDVLTFVIASLPAHGTLTGSGPNWLYVPAANYNGPDAFTFRVNDGTLDSAPAMVSLEVLSVNDAPDAHVRVLNLIYLTPGSTNGFVISPNNTNALVVLDGSLSRDVENDPLLFGWFRDGGSSPFASGVLVSNVFDVGSHPVLLVVDDGRDSGAAAVTVEVITPAGALEEIIAMLQSSILPRNRLRPLLATLKAATASFDRGNFSSSGNQLRAFQNKVRAQLDRSDPALAASLVQGVQTILDALN